MNQINYEERKKTYAHALFRYGPVHQLNKFDEELGEFLTELGKLLTDLARLRNGDGNKDNLAEELADVTIMMEQIRLIFDINDAVCEQMDRKILRLQKRVGLMRFDDKEEKDAE